ncbi:DM13 domain-containing protein [Algoriphagus litoralis]|uniref:DM13 domain-containing protein n=1 Tax=Algoriphagus litoralis TaxID=2202829 RepID=UPI000DB9CBE5|nr:DM13 domain-containing protein [Algoriphagus litoralis]
MKSILKILLALTPILFFSCEDNEGNPSAPDDNMEVMGEIEVIKAGTLTAQSSTNTMGIVSIVKDKDGKYFVQLSDTFTTKFSTGTVTVYLATSQTLALSNSASFQLVSIVGKPGEQFFSLPGLPDSKFTHAIIWCGAAAIPFGFAPLN